MQGQDTLVITGELMATKGDPNELQPTRGNVLNNAEDPLRTGTGAMIHLETGGTAEYIGVNSEGLSEQRTALENDRKRAEGKSAALSADSTDHNASGEALKTHVGARTASLNQIAKVGAFGLQWLLRSVAKWRGLDPNKVIVTPNLEFADYILSPATLSAVVAAKQMGLPLSWESIHKLAAKGNLTEMDFKTEKAIADAEREEMVPEGTGEDDDTGGKE